MNGDVEVFTQRCDRVFIRDAAQRQWDTGRHGAAALEAQRRCHFAGCYAEEAILLRLLGQLESAQPWFEKVPEL